MSANLVVAGFTPDVKLWEVSFDRGGGFKEVTRAFELKGHRSGVLSFSFSEGSARYLCVLVMLSMTAIISCVLYRARMLFYFIRD